MRASGRWEQHGDTLVLTSTPKPVKPVFEWSGLEKSETSSQQSPFIRVVLGTNGEPFRYASAELTCRNGQTFYGQIRRDGYPSTAALEYEDPLPAERDPRQSCDKPENLVLVQGVYSVRSRRFDLAELGWEPGQVARFVFHPNDMGVADFTGVTGTLVEGKLRLQGAEWPLELRKLPRK